MEIVLSVPFLSLSNANINFGKELSGLTYRSYTIKKALPTMSRMQLIIKHKFAKAVLNKNSEIFVMHIVVLEASWMIIHPS